MTIARVPKKNPTVDMAEAEKARKDGNTAIALGNYRRAFWRYADGLKAIRYADDDEEASSLRATLYANRAQAGLHLGFHQAACRDAAASLVEDPSRLKCWHRLGTALFNTGDPPGFGCVFAGVGAQAGPRALASFRTQSLRGEGGGRRGDGRRGAAARTVVEAPPVVDGAADPVRRRLRAWSPQSRSP